MRKLSVYQAFWVGTHKNSTGRLQNLQTEVLSTYQNLDSYIVDFLHNFTVKFGVFCPISENMKSQGQVLNCHNSKLRCHTNLLHILGSGAKVSLHFDCQYGKQIDVSRLKYFFIYFQNYFLIYPLWRKETKPFRQGSI